MVKGRRKFSGKTKTTHNTSKVNRVSNTRNLKTTTHQKNETYSMSNYDGVNKGFGSGSSSVGGFVGPGIPEVNAEPPPVDTPTTTGPAYGGSIEHAMTSETPKPTPRQTPPYEDITNEKGNMIHTVNFKNLYGDNKSHSINIKLKKDSPFAKNAPLMNMLAAMELQKDTGFQKKSEAMGRAQVPENLGTKETGDTIMDAAYTKNYIHGAHLKGQVDEFDRPKKSNAQIHHGNVFDYITDGYGGNYQTPNQKARPNSKDPKTSSLYNQRPKDWEPKKYGDRGLPGIGRISATGFAGGKRGDDPFKFTEPKNRGIKVIPDSGVPQWAKFKDNAIKTKAQYTKQVNDRKKRKNVSWGVIEGSQQKRDKMSLWGGQELPKRDWTDLGKVSNFANPKRAVQDENMEIYKIDQKKKRDAREAAKKSLADEYADLGS